MSATDQGDASLQRRALAAYLCLAEVTGDWVRQLVMLTGSDETAPVAAAVLAAGGTVLWTGRDAAALRESSLAGTIDFPVTTLSEALRILKNEIRKGLPVSVGVLDSGGRVWEEAVARGVQPDALVAGPADAAAAATLVRRGARTIEIVPKAEIREHLAANWRERRASDAALLAGLPDLAEPERAVAERWLRAVPRLFPRDVVRCYAARWDASNAL